MIEGNSPGLGLRVVEVKNIQGRCLDFSSKALVAIRSARGERCTLVQREIGRGIFTRRSRGGRARTSPPIPMHPGLSTGLRQQLLWSPRVEGTITGVYVRVACTQIQDSIRPLWECTKIAANKRRTLSLYLSLSLFFYPSRFSLELVCACIHPRTHIYACGKRTYIYTHAYRRSVVVCCSKREKWFAEGGGMKREGEEGEELKLPGKERNRVGLNLLDCFQLHASSLSLSLFLSFFILLPPLS